MPSPQELYAAGAQWDEESEGSVAPAPLLPPRRPSILTPGSGADGSAERLILRFNEATAASELDAMHAEQAAALLANASSPAAAGAGGRGGAAAASTSSLRSALSGGLASLEGDDSSDWGGDPLDMRFGQDPAVAYARYKARFGLSDSDSDMENVLSLGVDDDEDSRIAPMFSVGGAGVEAIPSEVLAELSTPFDFKSATPGAPYPQARTVREAAMSHDERILDEQRKALRELIERPLPMVNRPMWPTYAMIAGADQVAQVVTGGVVQSTRVMIVSRRETHRGARARRRGPRPSAS